MTLDVFASADAGWLNCLSSFGGAWRICIGFAFRALHFQSPATSYVLHRPATSCQDVETEKGEKIDATRMNEIMSKCLAAGQAEDLYISIHQGSNEIWDDNDDNGWCRGLSWFVCQLANPTKMTL